jgi:hypothetical protein
LHLLLDSADVGLQIIVALAEGEFGLDDIVHDVESIDGIQLSLLEGSLADDYDPPVELQS